MSSEESGPSGENNPPALFFCHQCNRRINEITEDFTCQRCGSGFIEEINGTNDEDAELPDEDEDYFESPPPAALRELTRTVLGMGIPSNEELRRLTGPGSLRGPDRRRGGRPNGRGGIRIMRHIPAEDGAAGSEQQIQFPDMFLNELLQNLAGIQPGEGRVQIFPELTMYGNPGDYVWGRNGLDTIVTQLMNQMEGSGPPPLRKELIEKIPQVKVTQIHIDNKAHCSVCWEDFIIEENVRQLNCKHIYHDPCIVPWLELHGTCPVCRRLQDDNPESSSEDSEMPSTSQSHMEIDASQTAPREQTAAGSLGVAISSVINNLFGGPLAANDDPHRQQSSRDSHPASEPTQNREDERNEDTERNNRNAYSGSKCAVSFDTF